MENKKTVLVVDDEEALRNFLSMRLSNAGYETIEASNGKDAIDIAKEKKLDLIILDIMMPEMDGMETSQQLKDCESTRDIPIIFLTALEDRDSEKLNHRSGNNIIFAKPYNPKELLAMVGKIIGG